MSEASNITYRGEDGEDGEDGEAYATTPSVEWLTMEETHQRNMEQRCGLFDYRPVRGESS